MAKRGEIAKKEAFYIPPRRNFSHYEAPITYVIERDFRLTCKGVPLCHNNVYLFRPEANGIEACDFKGLSHECNIKLMTTYRRDEFDMVALDELELNLAVMLTESGNQLRNEAGSQRRKKANPDNAASPAPDRANLSDSILNLRQRTFRPPDEILSGLRKKNARAPPDEKTGTERVF